MMCRFSAMNSYVTSKLWGSLLSDPEVAGALSATEQMTAMLRFERAWTVGLQATGHASAADAAAALSAIDGFQPDFPALAQATERDGLPVPELVRQLRSGLEDGAAKAIHTGSTSQDVLDTAFVLMAVPVLAGFQARLTESVAALDQLKVRFGARAMMGRTRMQAALPITVGQRVGTWTAPLARHLGDLAEVTARLSVLQAGGAVGDRAFQQGGDMLPVVADELGLTVGPVWHTDRTALVGLGHWLTKVAGSCAKIGKDISLMAQQGVDEVKLSGGGGSSAMPHKQNPVRAEVLVALARHVAGQNAVLAQAMIHEQERSGEAWTLEWLTLPAMLEAVGASLNSTTALLAQVTDLGRPD